MPTLVGLGLQAGPVYPSLGWTQSTRTGSNATRGGDGARYAQCSLCVEVLSVPNFLTPLQLARRIVPRI